MEKKTMSERSLRELYSRQLRDAAMTARELRSRTGVLPPEKAVLASLEGDMIQQSRHWEVARHD